MKFAVMLAAAMALPFAAHAADVKEMPPGLWEMKMKMEVPNLPPEVAAKMGGAGFNNTMTHCVKPGERKWSDREKGPMERSDRKCEQSDVKIDGNTISWKVKCADGTQGDGTVVHNGKDAYTLDTNMTTPRGSVKMHIDGKKIADTCEKK
jgi:hypothetical protein